MIVVSGLNRQTGSVRTQSFKPGKEGDARKFRSRLRSFGYTTAFVNEVKERYAASEASDNECGLGINDPVRYPYKVHSINTVNEQSQGSHVGFVATLHEAEVRAKKCVSSWNPNHSGAVIFKAIKLVRLHESPIEIIDL